MQGWIIGMMNRFGYMGIALLIAVENIFPPIPSEVILTFGGFMTTYTSMRVSGVILFSTIGSVLGAVVLYGIGRCFPPERLKDWLDSRWGKMLHFKSDDVERATGWFDSHGKPTVFFCRFIPIVRSLISIPAGIAKMGIGTFLTLTAIGTCIWNIALVYLGVLAGESWGMIVKYIGAYSKITLIVICAAILIFGVFYYKKRVACKNDERDNPIS